MVANQSNKQHGMTFISVIVMFLFIGFLLLAFLRIFPLYYENFSVKTALEGFVTEFNATPGMPVSEMRNSLQRRLDVQEVNSLKAKNVSIKSARGGYILDASYHPVVNYIGNVNFLLDFEHVVKLEK